MNICSKDTEPIVEHIKRRKVWRLALAFLLTLNGVLTIPPGLYSLAEPQLPPTQTAADADKGVVQGIVQRVGGGGPIADVEIGLEGGPVDARLVQILSRGLQAHQSIQFTATRLGTMEEVLQDAIDASGTQGYGPGFPGFDQGVDEFKAEAMKRFVAVSDLDGRFIIKDVPAGRYIVRANREGFLLDTSRGVDFNKVTVEPQKTANVAVTMLAGAVVSGRVLDVEGQPLQNADVQVLVKRYHNGFPELEPVITKLTDTRGAYRLFWLAPGEYYILASPRANKTAVIPLPKSFYPSARNADSAVPVVIRGGEQLPGMDIRMRNDQFAKVSGRLSTTIAPAETANQVRLLNGMSNIPPGFGNPSLTLVPRDPNTMDVGDGDNERAVGNIIFDGLTGLFETSGILPGSYYLNGRVMESNRTGGSGFAYGQVPIEIGNSDVSGVSIVVQNSVRVPGVVTVDGKAPGQTVARIMMQPDGRTAKIGIIRILGDRQAPSDAEGAFAVSGVPPGQYRVLLGPGLPGDVYLEDIRRGGGSVFDSGFEVGTEPPPPLQVILRSGAGTVDGTVEDATGKPMSGATVVLVPSASRRQNRGLYHTVRSDANGRFVIRSVAPGGYKLFAWQEAIQGGAYYNAGFLAKFEERGRPVNVSQASTVTEQIKAILPENGR